MPRTRSKQTTKAAATPCEDSILLDAKTLPPSDANPPKLFVLPSDRSAGARIVSLENPTNGKPSRYYFCPRKGFYEFTRISAPRKACRSWLITGEKDEYNATQEKSAKSEACQIGTGYIVKSADLLIATPVDILFLILPVLVANDEKKEQHFLELYDYFQALGSLSRHWKVMMEQHPNLEDMIARSTATVCDTVTAGDETMYRLSQEKLLKVLTSKAERMCKNGLPPSMEEKFVKRPLEVPITHLRKAENDCAAISNAHINLEQTDLSSAHSMKSNDSPLTAPLSIDSQSSTETTSTAATSIPSDPISPPPALVTTPEIRHSLRLRIALQYLIAAYIPKALLPTINRAIKSSTSLDFSSLDTHLAAIAALRKEAIQQRSISDNMVRKRAFEDDEEKIAEREEKKRRKEEEERTKKTESRAVKQLKKVDTSGMKKMSSFFTKVVKKT